MAYTLHPEIELGELQLKVSNLERSLRFYQDVVGFQIKSVQQGRAELSADGRRTLLILVEVPDAVIVPRRSMSGLYHFAILLPTRRDLGIALRRLVDSGIHIGQADHLVSEALYITDPDQNGIEIYRDRPRENWERDADGHYKMTSDPIDWDGLLQEAKDGSSEGLPSGTLIGHVHFHVGDLRKAKAFYCDLLGFDVAADQIRQMGALFISAGGYHHHIGLNIWAGANAPAVPANGTGVAYYTIVVPDQGELDTITDRLMKADLDVRERDGAWFVTDPSGIEIRLKVKERDI
ncbi:VOC family protein [Paenibacillus spongiae]|uniref:VOC family protein n=1 Tax=Paenibacillus spongiae TaxID=2909671 RepID=A0ABY5S437_9BACL|nr:VOC family protein [Paenibacillus spongiae]UVI28671.1 VOC family protein [Paenibacillus spongiae]